MLHQAHHRDFFLPIRDRAELVDLLHEQHLERAIGVVYLPETERISHYFRADLSSQFDGVAHFDVTHALIPLDRIPNTAHDELPETYPSGM
jgi:erythromycin esterase-like protein